MRLLGSRPNVRMSSADQQGPWRADPRAYDAEIGCRVESDGSVLFTVRDYGPGVPKAQMKRIFELFYRPANELTRDTVGTGIGLALVRQLADAMHAKIDVRNREPGAELRLRFPAAPAQAVDSGS